METVMCETLPTVLRRNHVTSIDVVQIDTEGYDFHVLKQLDFKKYRPFVIRIEWEHLPPKEKRSATKLLRGEEYRLALTNKKRDLIAWRPLF